jgi:hypothetical protein
MLDLFLFCYQLIHLDLVNNGVLLFPFLKKIVQLIVISLYKKQKAKI